MPSLTPIHKREEITWQAMREGLLTGGLTLVPAYGALHLAMQRSPKFVKSTNWQSRTALVIMPALFMFAVTAESKLNHGMRKLASDTSHAHETVKWAEQQQSEARNSSMSTPSGDSVVTQTQLMELYHQSVANSGIRIVPGNVLGFHHQVANFWQEHPFKMLAMVGIPTVGYVFYGRSQRAHLPTSLKLMHTRVYGQFAVISLLLSLMGFKAYMDEYGTFITQAEADERAKDMMKARQTLLSQLHEQQLARQEQERILTQARQKDLEKEQQEGQKSKPEIKTNDEGIEESNKGATDLSVAKKKNDMMATTTLANGIATI